MKWAFWMKRPVIRAGSLSALLAIIIIPYWWLAVQWSFQVISDPATRFTFTTTTFLLALIVIDSLFIIRYYQIIRKEELQRQTNELRKSEENNRIILEQAPFPIVITRISDSTIRFANQEASDYFSKEPSGVLGNHVQEYYADLKDREQILRLLKRDGSVSHYELQLLSPSRNNFWASLSATSILYYEQPCLFVSFIDISERKALETEIRKSEELYRSVVSASPDAIVFSDREGIITLVSPAAIQMFAGTTPEDFIGRSVFDFVHPDKVTTARKRVAALLSGKRLELYESAGKRLDGTIVPYEIHSELTFDDAGNPSGIVHILRDITRRKEDEAIVLESKERFETIFQEVPDPLLILDTSGIILEANASAKHLFHLSHTDIIGSSLPSTGLFQSSSDIDPYRFIMNSVPGETLDTRVFLPDGTWRYVTIKASKISIRSKPAILLLIHDTDESRRAQKAATQANAQLSLLNSITRHDIMNRVTVVMSYCDILSEEITDSRILQYITRVHDSGSDIQHLIDFTRQYQDLGIKEPQWQRIDQILKSPQIITLLRTITLSLPNIEYEIFADPMLEKVLYNLIENSLRHGEKVTQITISYEREDRWLNMIYSDNGVGIPDEEKPKIFHKGYGKNTGLGLFLIREILKISDISITEDGIVGEGVRFVMHIPDGIWRQILES